MEKKFENIDINTKTFQDSMINATNAELKDNFAGISYSDRILEVYFSSDISVEATTAGRPELLLPTIPISSISNPCDPAYSTIR